MDLNKKREQEKILVSQMIALYCHAQHHTGTSLCPQCARLEAYARSRSDHCPFMEHKTFCSNCSVHCYSPQMREEIRNVMRYAGPRMLFHRPIPAIHHMVCTILERRRIAKSR